MTSTATTALDLRDLGPGDALAYVAGCRRDADREEAHLLAGVVHWVDLHPVTEQCPAATPRSATRFLSEGDDGLVEPPLGGPGTPGVAEFAVEELAAALGSAIRPGCSWRWRRSSCATGCPGCGRWSRPGRCRRGRPGRWPGPPPASHPPRWR